MFEPISLDTLISVAGSPFIEYVCNLTSQELQSKREVNATLSPKKEQALKTLLICASRCFHASPKISDRRNLLVSHLSDYSKRFTDTITAIEIRRIGGGSLPLSSTKDPLLKELSVIASDIYPLFLIPVDSSLKPPYPDFPAVDIPHYNSTNIFHHPTNTRIATELTRDKVLQELFPLQQVGDTNSRAYMINGFNVAYGSVADVSTFTYGFIKQAFNTCATKGLFSYEEFSKQIKKNLNNLRRLVLGKQVKVPLISWVGGIKLEKGQKISTPWGTIRQAHEIEKIWLKAPYRDREDKIEVVLESTYELTMTIARSLEDIPSFTDQSKSSVDTEEKLAIISALPQIALNKTMRITLLTSKVIPPFQSGDSMFYSSNVPVQTHQSLTSEEISRVEELALMVSNTNYEKVAISFRRLSSAVNRSDITDSFIDLIIIWENLFGYSGEVKFRIAVAISKLLYGNEVERSRAYKQISKIYTDRSKIVHGTKHYNYREISQLYNDTLTITIQVLRKIFYHQPDLLNYNSRTRSKKISLR